MSRRKYGPGRVILKAEKRRFVMPDIFSRLRLASYSGGFRGLMQCYRRQLYAISLLFIVMLLDSTLMNYCRTLFGLKPGTILAALVFLVPFFNLGWMVMFAFLAGLFRDAFSLLPFGFSISVCIVLVILAKQISRRFSAEDNLIRCVMLCLIILLNNLATSLVLFVLDRPVVIGVFLSSALREAVFTLLLGLPMYRLFTNIFSDENP